jgi:membrane-associated phospholipid phosphatase
MQLRGTYNLKFQSQKISYSLLISFFIIGAPVLLFWSKEDVFLYLHGLHSEFGDMLFPFVTYAGDGWLVLPVLIGLLFYKFGYALDFTIASLLSLLFVQSGKRFFFADWMRPLGTLGEDMIHTIEGVKVHAARSFPSGHSTTAMLIFFYLALISKNPLIKLACILAAFAGGYSRIYLGQHFFTDVYAGFAIGIVCIVLAALWRNSHGEYSWYNRKIRLN